MSEPTRYRVADNQAQLTLGGGVLVVDPAGPIVAYGAYAKLQAENERLRKAGDAMVEAFDLKYPVAGGVIKAWKEAKEGKPSA